MEFYSLSIRPSPLTNIVLQKKKNFDFIGNKKEKDKDKRKKDKGYFGIFFIISIEVLHVYIYITVHLRGNNFLGDTYDI